MIKIAIFVEGHTELQFTQRIIEHVCQNRGYTVEVKEQRSKILHNVSIKNNGALDISHYILIVNCCTDTQVKSQINQQYTSLLNSGYTKIIGLRDIYPFKHADIPRLQNMLNMGIQAGPVPVEIILAILEIETWFIGELTHFGRLIPAVNIADVKTELLQQGIDFQTSHIEDIQHPAIMLNQIYSKSGLSYRKKIPTISRTVNALCMNSLFVNTRNMSPSLDRLLTSIEDAL